MESHTVQQNGNKHMSKSRRGSKQVYALITVICGKALQSTAEWGRGPGLEPGISHSDPGALQVPCVIL